MEQSGRSQDPSSNSNNRVMEDELEKKKRALEHNKEKEDRCSQWLLKRDWSLTVINLLDEDIHSC